MEVEPGVHRLTNGVSNYYIFDEGGKLTLVDAGTPKDWEKLLAALESMGRHISDIDAVLLTHAHSDHTGFAEQARTEAEATVYVHTADVDVAKSGNPMKAERGYFTYLFNYEGYHTLFGLMRRGGLNIVPIKEVSSFDDGEVIDVPGKPRAVHMPGHTAGSAALWFESHSIICTGDCLVNRNPMTGRRGPQIMPASLNVDSQQALASLVALETITADVILPGHGEPWKHGVNEAYRMAKLMGPS